MQQKSSVLFAALIIAVCMMGVVFPVTAVVANGPDLTGISVSGPATGVAGKSVSLSATVRNTGTASTGSSYVYFYLSKETSITSSDVYLGKVYLSSLSPGSQKTVMMSAMVPLSTPQGSYYYGAIADGSKVISETNEGNNAICSAAVVQVSEPPKPDLVITSVGSPSAGIPGKSVALNASVKNPGSVSASYFYVAFYLSKDLTIDSRDVSLNKVYVSSLYAGSSKTVSLTTTIPSGTTEGSYYICALADGTNRISEQDESNNARTSGILTVQGGTVIPPPTTVSPKPDLIITGVTAPSTGSAGSSISVSASVKNAGSASATYSYLHFYLSPDSIPDSGDIYLGQSYVSSLLPGYSKSVSSTVTIPATASEGSYYVCARADATSLVSESNESNNAGSIPGTISITVAPAGTFTEQVEAAIVKYTNQERSNTGQPALTRSPILSALARSHSQDMMARNFWGHINPDGLDPFERMNAGGYLYWCAAENIGYTSSFIPSSNPDEVGRYFVQEMWMKSTGHRANILNSCVTEIGVGIAYEPDRSASPYGVIATQDFGKPR